MLQHGGENPPRVRRCEASALTKIHVKLLGGEKKNNKNLQDDSQHCEFASLQLLCVVDPLLPGADIHLS